MSGTVSTFSNFNQGAVLPEESVSATSGGELLAELKGNGMQGGNPLAGLPSLAGGKKHRKSKSSKKSKKSKKNKKNKKSRHNKSRRK